MSLVPCCIGAAVALVGSRVEANPTCGPAVQLFGDPAAITEIARSLEARGISGPQPGCPSGHVGLRIEDGVVVVAIVDRDNRRTEHHVTTLAIAATWIESFVLEVDAGLPISIPPMPSTRASDPEQPTIVVNEVHQPTRGTLGVTAETSFGSDGSFWYGLHARGCVALGPACVGAEVRVANDSELSGETTQTLSSRSAADVLLMVEARRVLHGVVVTPGVGLGVGMIRTRSDLDSMTIPAPSNAADVGGLRANLHLAVVVPLRPDVMMTLGATLDVSPFAHTDPFKFTSGQLAGEPRGYGRIELGLALVRR